MDLERARLALAEARNRLTTIRETLDYALDEAYRRQSFAPLGDLFREEETTLAACEDLVDRLARAEERWCLLRAALAQEIATMTAPVLRQRLN